MDQMNAVAFLSWMKREPYEKTGPAEVWIASSQTGLEKCQCIVHLSILADGSALSPPLIFRDG